MGWSWDTSDCSGIKMADWIRGHYTGADLRNVEVSVIAYRNYAIRAEVRNAQGEWRPAIEGGLCATQREAGGAITYGMKSLGLSDVLHIIPQRWWRDVVIDEFPQNPQDDFFYTALGELLQGRYRKACVGDVWALEKPITLTDNSVVTRVAVGASGTCYDFSPTRRSAMRFRMKASALANREGARKIGTIDPATISEFGAVASWEQMWRTEQAQQAAATPVQRGLFDVQPAADTRLWLPVFFKTAKGKVQRVRAPFTLAVTPKTRTFTTGDWRHTKLAEFNDGHYGVRLGERTAWQSALDEDDLRWHPGIAGLTLAEVAKAKAVDEDAIAEEDRAGFAKARASLNQALQTFVLVDEDIYYRAEVGLKPQGLTLEIRINDGRDNTIAMSEYASVRSALEAQALLSGRKFRDLTGMAQDAVLVA